MRFLLERVDTKYMKFAHAHCVNKRNWPLSLVVLLNFSYLLFTKPNFKYLLIYRLFVGDSQQK